MESRATGPDTLATSQQRLFVQIKRSHRLLVAQLYSSLLYIPGAAAIFLLVASYGRQTPDSVGSVVMPLLFMIGGFVILGRQLKEVYSFFRASRSYFRAIEYATDPSQITIGLTSYVHHLVRLMQSPFFREKPPETLPDGLERLEHQMKRQVYVFILLLFLTGSFLVLWLVGFIAALDTGSAPSEVFTNPLLYVAIGSFVVVPVIMLRLFLQRKQLVSQWTRGFQELIAWEKSIEQLFLQQHAEEEGKL